MIKVIIIMMMMMMAIIIIMIITIIIMIMIMIIIIIIIIIIINIIIIIIIIIIVMIMIIIIIYIFYIIIYNISNSSDCTFSTALTFLSTLVVLLCCSFRTLTHIWLNSWGCPNNLYVLNLLKTLSIAFRSGRQVWESQELLTEVVDLRWKVHKCFLSPFTFNVMNNWNIQHCVKANKPEIYICWEGSKLC